MEADKFKGDGAGLLASKLARIEAILAEMASREVARIIERERPELKDKLDALRKEVETLKK